MSQQIVQFIPGDKVSRMEILNPTRPGEHVWVAVAAFRVTEESIRSGEPQHLDRENLATIDIGCFQCEQPYSERLSYRKCVTVAG